MTSKIIIAGFLFVLVLVSGFWMSKLGRPYQPVLFTFHKLLTLAAIVLSILAILNFNKQTALSPMQLSFAIAIGIILIGSMITGGIISAKEEVAQLIKTAHKASSALSSIGLVYLYYTLLKG